MTTAVTLPFQFSAQQAHARSRSAVEPDTLALVQSLPAVTRRAVTLRFVYGLSQAEIATRLNLAPEEVVTHLAGVLRAVAAEGKGARHDA